MDSIDSILMIALFKGPIAAIAYRIPVPSLGKSWKSPIIPNLGLEFQATQFLSHASRSGSITMTPDRIGWDRCHYNMINPY